MGLIRVTALPQAMPWSLLFGLFPMSRCLSLMGSCKASRKEQCSLVYGHLYGPEELTLQLPLAQQWLEMGYSCFQTLRYFTLKCQNMSNVDLSSQKALLLIVFLGGFFLRVSISDKKQHLALRRVIFHIRKHRKTEHSTEN